MKNKVHGTNHFDRWFKKLDKATQGRMNRRIARAKGGNFGEVEASSDGILEMKLRFGSGYRIYYFQRGPNEYIVLIGGIKDTQQRDFDTAKALKRIIEKGGTC